MSSLKLSALVLLLLFFSSGTRAQSEPREQKKVTDTEVTNLEIEDKNVNHLLAEIAYKYGVVSVPNLGPLLSRDFRFLG